MSWVIIATHGFVWFVDLQNVIMLRKRKASVR
jgi:hypothetical protein